MLEGRVGVDDEADIVNVDSSRGDIGGHHGNSSSLGKSGQILHSSGLGKIALHLYGRNTGLVQLLGQLLGPVLHSREDDDLARS